MFVLISQGKLRHVWDSILLAQRVEDCSKSLQQGDIMLNKTTFQKKIALSSLTLVLGLSVPVFAHNDYTQNSANSYPSTTGTYGTDNGSVGISDQDLTKKIHDKIGSGWFSKGYDPMNVQVNNGNVTLQGTVKTWDDKEKVEKTVRNIEGVKSLTSQINVQEPASKEIQKRKFPQDTYSSNADDQLNKKIRDNVSTGWLWDSYKEVALNTADGVVTLVGAVDNMSDQQKLMTEIQKIDGVKAVKSNLKIKNR